MSTLLDTVEMVQHLPLVYLAVGLYLMHWIFSHPVEWQAFLESLDTNGGHIMLLAGAMALGYRMFQSDSTAGGQIITGAWAALLVLLNVRRSKDQGLGRSTDPTGANSTTATTMASATVITPVAAVPETSA